MDNSINLPSKLTIDFDGGVITVTNATQSVVLTGATSGPRIQAALSDGLCEPVVPKVQSDDKETAPITPFASEKRQPRRYKTGRNQQLNIKATGATADRLYRLADFFGVTLGEVLERALLKLEDGLEPDIDKADKRH